MLSCLSKLQSPSRYSQAAHGSPWAFVLFRPLFFARSLAVFFSLLLSLSATLLCLVSTRSPPCPACDPSPSRHLVTNLHDMHLLPLPVWI